MKADSSTACTKSYRVRRIMRAQLEEHRQIAEDLLEGEARPDIADPREARDPHDPAVGDLDVAALVVGEHVHLVPATAEKFQDQPHGDRRAAGLEKGLGGEQENLHRAPALRSSAVWVPGSVPTSGRRGCSVSGAD